MRQPITRWIWLDGFGMRGYCHRISSWSLVISQFFLSILYPFILLCWKSLGNMVRFVTSFLFLLEYNTYDYRDAVWLWSFHCYRNLNELNGMNSVIILTHEQFIAVLFVNLIYRVRKFSRRPRSRKWLLPWPVVDKRRRSGTRVRWGKRLTPKCYLMKMAGYDYRPKYPRYVKFFLMFSPSLFFFWRSTLFLAIFTDEISYTFGISRTFEDQFIISTCSMQIFSRGREDSTSRST